jgi:hypothetical protein
LKENSATPRSLALAYTPINDVTKLVAEVSSKSFLRPHHAAQNSGKKVAVPDFTGQYSCMGQDAPHSPPFAEVVFPFFFLPFVEVLR